MFLSLVFPLSPPPQGSSSSTVHEQRSFERKAEEDDGKVSFWVAASFAHSGGLLFLLHPFPPQPAVLWLERKSVGLREASARVGRVAPVQTTPCAWACECVTMETGRATDTSRSQSLSCLLPPTPHTPSPPPHPPVLTSH